MRAVLGLSVLGVASAQQSPIEKVISVLTDLKAELEADTKKDAKWWAKTECQCDADEKKNAKTISDAGDAINQAQQTMDKNQGVAAESKVRIDQLEEDLANATNERRDAQKKRDVDAAAHNLFQQDCTSIIQGLGNALTVLNCSEGFLQTGKEGFLQVTSQKAKQALAALPKIYNRFVRESPGGLTPVERQTLESFIQQSPDFGAQTSSSGKICGILEGMHDTYKKDCSDDVAKEAEDKKSHEERMGLIQGQLDDMTHEHKSRKSRRGDAMETFANAKKAHRENTKIREDTTKMEADRAKLCAELSDDYKIRMKERAEELKGVTEALNILDDPKMNAQLMNAEGLFFLQVAKVDRSRRATTVATEMIEKSLVGKRKSPQLLNLMQQLGGAGQEAFKVIIDKIKEFVKNLEDKIKQDSADRDLCISDIAKLAKTKQSNENELKKLSEEIDTLKVNIETLSKEIEEITNTIAELKAAMVKASDDRQEENANHQTRMQELFAGVKILDRVVGVLGNVYNDKKDNTRESATLLQQSPIGKTGSANSAQKKEGKGAIAMIETIISEMKAEMKESTTQENSQATRYESLYVEQNEAMEDLNRKMADNKDQRSKAEQKQIATEEKATDMANTLENTTTTKKDRETECDFLLQNFTAMQEHNQGEIEALNQAAGYLQGMN